ncbi:hypothetical protein TNCV_3714181 [Trichonephila clavipes]|nr:hypothetical protein TNCV_3714181 [Trichonephila clavipes]
MPSCHSAHDLEWAVQDLWAHLPQDNIRCLINSMPVQAVDPYNVTRLSSQWLECSKPLYMEVPLSICIKKESRAGVHFLLAEDFKPAEIILRLQVQYGDSCLSRSKIYEWKECLNQRSSFI